MNLDLDLKAIKDKVLNSGLHTLEIGQLPESQFYGLYNMCRQNHFHLYELSFPHGYQYLVANQRIARIE